MPNLRADVEGKSAGAALQYAFFRTEGALIVAGAIVAFALLPFPSRRWVWWLALGLIGWGAIVVTSLTDPETTAKVMWQLLRERLKLDEIQNDQIGDRVRAMTDYIRAVETDLRRLEDSPNKAGLEAAAGMLYDWVEQSALFARFVDTYRRDYRLEERRAELPQLIQTLVARLKYEKDQAIIDRLNREMESLGKAWQTLGLLDAQMQQAEPQLGQMLTALARATSEMHVIASERGVGQDHASRIKLEIQRHLGQITDLVTQMEQLYSEALNKR
ncbi:MAG: hypothetical protein MUF84_09390 [Anaerolineae bacterium]|jgi:hypothetical protein|nr:hypothetical protein [Anaerolineae bacterium]